MLPVDSVYLSFLAAEHPPPDYFYVDNPIASSGFYRKLFNTEPDLMLLAWAAFYFNNGLNLGLWSTAAREFVFCGEGNRTELSFMVRDI